MHRSNGVDERAVDSCKIELHENKKRRLKCKFFAVREGLAAQVVLSDVFPSLNRENESCEREWTDV